jgi:hypothetical protein
MNLNLEIIKVSKPEHKAGKGRGYNTIEVTYKDITAGGKVGGKKLVDFGDYVHVYNVAKDWEEGQTVCVETQKVDGYWTWVNILDSTSSETPKRNEVENTPTKSTKQQWVPDEVRQRLIVRQTALERAIAFESGNSPTIEDVFATAEKFVDWVFEVQPTETPAKRGRKPKVVEETPPEVE